MNFQGKPGRTDVNFQGKPGRTKQVTSLPFCQATEQHLSKLQYVLLCPVMWLMFSHVLITLMR